jgi:hypothetical protein
MKVKAFLEILFTDIPGKGVETTKEEALTPKNTGRCPQNRSQQSHGIA